MLARACRPCISAPTSPFASPSRLGEPRLYRLPQADLLPACAQLAEWISRASVILREVGFRDASTPLPAGETAGIPFAAWIADFACRCRCSMCARSPRVSGAMPRSRGISSRARGCCWWKDLTTDGRSKIKFVDAMRKSGLIVEHAFVVFHYDIFPADQRRCCARMASPCMRSPTWWDVLRVAKTMEYFRRGTLREVEAFRNNPAEMVGGPPNWWLPRSSAATQLRIRNAPGRYRRQNCGKA